MPDYKTPLRDIRFVHDELLGYPAHYQSFPEFKEVTPDLVQSILEQGAKFAEEVLAPLNRVGDREGCTWSEGGVVKTPTGFKEAYRQYVGSGWPGLAAPLAHGGQGLPESLALTLLEMIGSANWAWGMYPVLATGAKRTLDTHGTDEQKKVYLPKLVSGQWTGTMCLTEPHCGSDVGLLRTKAEPQADGGYRITGTKIFISSGEHDMAENIVHIVLARLPDAPAGTKGISLFIVPKFVPDAKGEVGRRNGVSCGSIEHKMGIHGNSTCVMNYDNATGWLVGEENKGLNAMFVMMNEARLGVGVQGLAQSEVAYQNAVAYAKDRLQGRALTGPKAPDKAADPIIVHPDVRRTLMTIRAFNEAARAMMVWMSLKGDVAHRSGGAKEREAADDMMGLLTPVLKGVLTDVGFANTVSAQQMYGGHGYIAEQGMEQFVRDARIAMIYEGANGIQALDLVGRKLPRDGGRAVTAYFAEVGAFVKDNASNEAMKPVVGPLTTALGHLQQATQWLIKNGAATPDNAGAAATDYMYLFGLVTLGYMWGLMVKAAQTRLATAASDHLKTKLVTGKFFAERMLPETALHLARIQAGAATVMELPADAF